MCIFFVATPCLPTTLALKSCGLRPELPKCTSFTTLATSEPELSKRACCAQRSRHHLLRISLTYSIESLQVSLGVCLLFRRPRKCGCCPHTGFVRWMEGDRSISLAPLSSFTVKDAPQSLAEADLRARSTAGRKVGLPKASAWSTLQHIIEKARRCKKAADSKKSQRRAACFELFRSPSKRPRLSADASAQQEGPEERDAALLSLAQRCERAQTLFERLSALEAIAEKRVDRREARTHKMLHWVHALSNNATHTLPEQMAAKRLLAVWVEELKSSRNQEADLKKQAAGAPK